MKQRGLARYRTTLGLAGAVLACTGYLWWDRARATTEEMAARRQNVFRAFHRERVDRIEIERRGARFELRKDRDTWFVISDRGRRTADSIECERLLSELEGAEAQRLVGTVDTQHRERFGLATPRARVVVHEGTEVSARFSIGARVEQEEGLYVEASAASGERDHDVRVVVLARSFGEPFDRAATEFRDRKVAELNVDRLERMELNVGERTTVLEHRSPVWRLRTPDLGRASRAAVETITSELNDLRATRVLLDDADDAALARHGLTTPSVRLRILRGAGVEPVVLRIGGTCPEHDDEFAATRDGSGTIVCLGRSFVDSLRVPAEGFRDDRMLSARTDEVAEVRIKGAGVGGADLVIKRDQGTWRGEASPYDVDVEAVEGWLGTLHDVSTSQRVDGSAGDPRSTHGLLPPTRTIEVRRTGVEGVERIHVGTLDDTGLYVSRDDETVVLRFAPSLADTLRPEAIRFRTRKIVRDVEDELRMLRIDAGDFHEELGRDGGILRVLRPVNLAADPNLASELAHTLASLDADRWVSAEVRPEHGLASPRARIEARFEGPGLHDESDGGADAAVARVRSYVISFGASAPGGGVYATLDGGRGVFVASRAFFETVTRPHVDRAALRVLRDEITRVTLTLGGAAPRTLVLTRSAQGWRTGDGTPVDASRIDSLLDPWTTVSSPRVFGYGPAPAAARFATPTLSIELMGRGDAGHDMLRVVVGDRFGSGAEAGFYARREDVDATFSLPEAIVEAMQHFRP